jgi:hypothetical protein
LTGRALFPAVGRPVDEGRAGAGVEGLEEDWFVEDVTAAVPLVEAAGKELPAPNRRATSRTTQTNRQGPTPQEKCMELVLNLNVWRLLEAEN